MTVHQFMIIRHFGFHGPARTKGTTCTLLRPPAPRPYGGLRFAYRRATARH